MSGGWMSDNFCAPRDASPPVRAAITTATAGHPRPLGPGNSANRSGDGGCRKTTGAPLLPLPNNTTTAGPPRPLGPGNSASRSGDGGCRKTAGAPLLPLPKADVSLLLLAPRGPEPKPRGGRRAGQLRTPSGTRCRGDGSSSSAGERKNDGSGGGGERGACSIVPFGTGAGERDGSPAALLPLPPCAIASLLLAPGFGDCGADLGMPTSGNGLRACTDASAGDLKDLAALFGAPGDDCDGLFDDLEGIDGASGDGCSLWGVDELGEGACDAIELCSGLGCDAALEGSGLLDELWASWGDDVPR
ncbi:hypothetical protein FOA52_006017 [Chlamydomonas sp. UWO 241]|nr:hypothetical protein FOA52_006017 [Chlamydomonas sp. UWO 241]